MDQHEGRKMKILFLCVNNSVRSQMAEGLMRKLYGDRFDVYSAGSRATAVNPYAVRVMEEIGADISGQRSKSVEEYIGQDMDYVVTLCDDPGGTCPVFPGGGRRLHRPFTDPARYSGNEREMLGIFRRVRNEIDDWLQETFAGEAAPGPVR
jgi:arsenate reductase